MKKTKTQDCNDAKCSVHGTVTTRGREFAGTVVKTDAHKSATVEWTRTYPIPKFERYEKRKTRLRVHNPSCITAIKGDLVQIKETRPLSKTKKFVIIEKVGADRLFKEREKALEESKVKVKEVKDASSESQSD